MNLLKETIILPGGAGLVGQNLVVRLKELGYTNLIVLDKHRANLEIMRKLHPDITIEYTDLSESGKWVEHFLKHKSAVIVMLQAQIGGNIYEEFIRNNIDSTRNILNIIKSNPTLRLIHISSSVVESMADDFYTKTKIIQEKMVLDSKISCPILRPTLMFGWFDRKHLGWLSRFIKKIPVFPIPGNGRYMRQPLYVRDFCNVITSCIEGKFVNNTYNISGHENIDYIDIIRKIKSAKNLKTPIIHLPYNLFYSLLWCWSIFDKNPPFTTHQLKALVCKDEFEVSDWPNIFKVNYTPFDKAIAETFQDSRYSNIVLEF